MSHERAKQLLDQSEEFIEKCKQEAAEGKDVDMAGFEQTVQEFCGILDGMSKEDAMQYEEGLKNISTNLASLSEELVKRRDAIKDQVQGLDVNKSAQAAYKKADLGTTEE